ncbi:transposable element Tcb2 transposase [Trichonephila clavipes]|nr:transposable element Tcb2 transposase [Trichonephila clavipes]
MVISKLWKQFETTDAVRKPGKNRPKAKTLTKDRYLKVNATSSQRAKELVQDFAAATRNTISRKTVYKRVIEKVLCARWPVVCVSFNSLQKKARLLWSQEHAKSRAVFLLLMSPGSVPIVILVVFSFGASLAPNFLTYELNVRLFREEIGQDFSFRDLNAMPHRAHLSEDFLEEDICRM